MNEYVNAPFLEGETEEAWTARQQPADASGYDPNGAAARAARRRADKGAKYDAELEKTNEVTNWLRNVFYVLVLAVALAGQVSGAHEAIGIPVVWAVPAVAVLELGGVVIMRIAEVRRRLGESAVFPMMLAFAVGGFAIAFNWMAHSNHKAGVFFAFMSFLGFAVWILSTEHRRRDRLRANGQMSDLPPQYEFVTHWVRHPWITLRARSMAKANPKLGLTGSLFQAEMAMRRDKRVNGIRRVLKRKISKAVDPITAKIATNAYDLDRVADDLERTADYAGLTDLIAADLIPSRIAAHQRPVRVPSIVHEPVDPEVVRGQVLDVVQEAMAGQLAAIEAATSAATAKLEAAANFAASRMPELAAEMAGEMAALGRREDENLADELAGEMADELADEDGDDRQERENARGQSDGQQRGHSRPRTPSQGPSVTARKVAAALAKNPDLTTAQLAAKLSIPDRTIRRHLAAIRPATEPVNGFNHGAAR